MVRFAAIVGSFVRADGFSLESGGDVGRPSVFNRGELIGVVTLAAVVLFLPLGGARIAVSAILLGFGSTMYTLRLRVSPELSEGIQVWLGVVVALTIGTIQPSLLAAAIVAVAGLIIAGTREMGRSIFWVLGLALLWLVVVHLVITPTPDYLPTLALALLAPGHIQYSLWAAGQQDVRRRRERLFMHSGRAVAWEFDIERGRFLSLEGPTMEMLGLDQQEALAMLNASPLGAAYRGRPISGDDWTVEVPHVDGSRRRFRVSALRRSRADGLEVSYGIAIDITDVEAGRLAELQRAERDALTGLPNRDGFAKFLDEAVARGGRVVLVVDLDRFKDINDSLGHLAGDGLIAAVAHRLDALKRQDVCIARLGGDEFAVAIVTEDDTTTAATAEDFAAEIEDALHDSFAIAGFEVSVSGSVGIAAGSELDWLELLRRADGAMYSAKRTNDFFRWYDPAHDVGSADRLRQRNMLKSDLESQIVLHYQPIVDSSTRRLHSVERSPGGSIPNAG